jgi:hypothetical protein
MNTGFRSKFNPLLQLLKNHFEDGIGISSGIDENEFSLRTVIVLNTVI